MIAVDPYACVVKAKEKYFDGWETVGHVTEKISPCTYFFIKKNGKITDNVKSLNYKSSPFAFGGLDILLQLAFSYHEEWARHKKKDLIEGFYSYDFTGILHNDESSDIEIDLQSVNVKEYYDEEEADKVKPVGSVVDKEIANTLIQQETTCITTDDD